MTTGMGTECLTGTGFLLGWWIIHQWCLHNTVNVLKSTELYTIKWLKLSQLKKKKKEHQRRMFTLFVADAFSLSILREIHSFSCLSGRVSCRKQNCSRRWEGCSQGSHSRCHRHNAGGESICELSARKSRGSESEDFNESRFQGIRANCAMQQP